MRALAALVALVAAGAVAAPAGAQAPGAGGLRAGVGEADITPPRTGYYLGGWTRADRLVEGQQTRLFAKAMVLEQDGRKVALVSVELFMVPGGLQQHVAEAVADRGFTTGNVLMSATHTHAGPGGFANYATLNTAAPNARMLLTDPRALGSLLNPVRADPQLYTFLVQQISAAIREADDRLAPAVAGWGDEQLYGLTRNRSLEAHLANHGIRKRPGEGRVEDDPEGYPGTIDPEVDVLRVDRVVDGERRPIGVWSQFAAHATVVKSEIRAYTGDHNAVAMRVFEREVREEADVPDDEPVVNVFANGAEGDMSAGLDHTGPAGADEVGRVEAQALLRAWRRAGDAMTSSLPVDVRWTQTCFCGQRVEGGRVADRAYPGIPFLTGSEEGRGPLYDVTRQSWEGVKGGGTLLPGHGHKVIVPVGSFPKSVPLMVVRVGDRMIASIPGEPTKESGARVKHDVLRATSPAGVRKVVIAGLTNEYINYITTPEEYDTQHYEGGSTMYGRLSLNLLRQSLTDLSSRLVRGEAAPPPRIYDAKRGVVPNGTPYPEGSATGTLLAEPPARVARLGHATLSWQGGPYGADRPVGDAFLRAERRVGDVWEEVDSDLGLAMLWRVGRDGRYEARWEVPRDAPTGEYRLVVTATRYRLVSAPFTVEPAATLTVAEATAPPGRVAVRVGYPAARENVDLTARPDGVRAGTVTFTVGGDRRTVPISDGLAEIDAPAGVPVTVAAGGAQDEDGNTSGEAVALR
ncbi:MAG: neutral/alkaline non-lysosomal ceramidase N-terminal domain-containing protein [Solirubrobacteraceae bacterium]|nr:neutral/alkaline non-lysosomal ceramidase N-terminal domain-containing protein [Solirubrobacteraceae bacterium]